MPPELLRSKLQSVIDAELSRIHDSGGDLSLVTGEDFDCGSILKALEMSQRDFILSFVLARAAAVTDRDFDAEAVVERAARAWRLVEMTCAPE